MKNEIEERHILAFWESLNEFSDCLPNKQAPPEPDFYVETDSGLIGIEHTQLIRKKDHRGIDPMQHSKCADRIMNQAEQAFNRILDVKLWVSVRFRSDYGLVSSNPTFLANSDIQPLAAFVADFVVKNIPPPGITQNFENFDWNKSEFRFPEKIDLIKIGNPGYENVCWSASQGGVVPPIFKSDAFTITLKKKNRKPKNYSKHYDQIWLVMVENQTNLTSYFDWDNCEVPILVSSFDRVFVFRYASKEIIECNVKKNQ